MDRHHHRVPVEDDCLVIRRARATLAGIVWLLDIRHDPSRDDREMQELLSDSGRPVLATFTKTDKLTRSALPARVRELARTLDLEPEQIQLTSSKSGLGMSDLAGSIVAAEENRVSVAHDADVRQI